MAADPMAVMDAIGEIGYVRSLIEGLVAEIRSHDSCRDVEAMARDARILLEEVGPDSAALFAVVAIHELAAAGAA